MKICPTCSMRYPDEAQKCLLHPVALLPFLDPRLGTTIAGRYVVESILGEGGMATVYRARQRMSDRTVALKVMNLLLASDKVVAERFRREAKNASKLAHPNIIEIFEQGEVGDGTAFIAMELLAGEPLDALLARGIVPLAKALPIMVQCARGIARAHDFDVIHRDLKPENIFLAKREDGTDLVKLLDFGIARSLTDVRLTNQGDLFGTPQYMSPERINGKDTTYADDLYSLGVVFFEIVTGKLPFDAADIASFFVKHLTEVPALASTFMPDVPPLLDALIARLMAKDPKARPVDAHEVEQTLLDVAKAQAVELPPSVTDEPQSSALPTTVPEGELDGWAAKLAVGERMLHTAFGERALAPSSLLVLHSNASDLLKKLATARETRLAFERDLGLSEAKQREGRQRFGFAMDAIGIDASTARAELRDAALRHAQLTPQVEEAKNVYLAALRDMMRIEGQCGMVNPSPELAAIYRTVAVHVDAWLLAAKSVQNARTEIQAREVRVTDLEFQLGELRAATSRYEERAEAERAAHQSNATSGDVRAETFEAELRTALDAFATPLRLRPELSRLLNDFDRSTAPVDARAA